VKPWKKYSQQEDKEKADGCKEEASGKSISQQEDKGKKTTARKKSEGLLRDRRRSLQISKWRIR